MREEIEDWCNILAGICDVIVVVWFLHRWCRVESHPVMYKLSWRGNCRTSLFWCCRRRMPIDINHPSRLLSRFLLCWLRRLSTCLPVLFCFPDLRNRSTGLCFDKDRCFGFGFLRSVCSKSVSRAQRHQKTMCPVFSNLLGEQTGKYDIQSVYRKHPMRLR